MQLVVRHPLARSSPSLIHAHYYEFKSNGLLSENKTSHTKSRNSTQFCLLIVCLFFPNLSIVVQVRQCWRDWRRRASVRMSPSACLELWFPNSAGPCQSPSRRADAGPCHISQQKVHTDKRAAEVPFFIIRDKCLLLSYSARARGFFV